MSRRRWSWLAMSFALLLAGCLDGGGGEGGGLEGLPLAFQTYIKASGPDTSDHFGQNMAIDGDTLVIGVPDEDSAGIGVNSGMQGDNTQNGSGAVYVFVRTNGLWSQQAYIKASNAESGDAFGSSVAISGDTMVVGAIGEGSAATGIGGTEADNTVSDSGAVYVFLRNAGVWSQQAYVKASNTGSGDAFGSSVAISGDTMAVGAPGEASNAVGVNPGILAEANNTASRSGAVYVFTRSGTIWSQQAYMKASNTGGGDAFGASVGIDSDTVVVGAAGEDSNLTGVTTTLPNDTATGNLASDSGAVYIFSRSGVIWSQQAYLKASNAGVGDAFGTSVSISGSLLAVGMPGEDGSLTMVLQGSPSNVMTNDGASNAGAVCTFVSSGGVWSQQAYLKAPNAEAGDAFGTSVAVSSTMVAAGAISEDSSAFGIDGNQNNNSASASGAAYLFR